MFECIILLFFVIYLGGLIFYLPKKLLALYLQIKAIREQRNFTSFKDEVYRLPIGITLYQLPLPIDKLPTDNDEVLVLLEKRRKYIAFFYFLFLVPMVGAVFYIYWTER